MKGAKRAAALALLVLISSCSAEKRPITGATTGPPSLSPSPSPTPPTVRLIVWSGAMRCPSNQCRETPTSQDLFIYDTVGGENRRLTNDGARTAEDQPRFATADEITYVVADEGRDNVAFWRIRTDGGPPSLLLRTGPGRIDSYDWSADGRTLVFLKSSADGREHVTLWRRGESSPRSIRAFPSGGGRGVGDSDDVNVEWSPDGSMMLVSHTFLDGRNIFVIRPDGKDVMPPLDGSFGRWVAEDTFLYRSEDLKGVWRTVRVPAGTTTELAMGSGTIDPEVSPDRKHVAYHNGNGRPTTYIYELATNIETEAGTGAVPIWITNGALAATEGRPCADDECGEAPAWVPTGSSFLLAPETPPAKLPIAWTVNADRLLE